MASVGGPTSHGAPARRQWCAAVLVIGAIPAGVTAGLVASDLASAWILAGTALVATLVLLAGAPTRGPVAPAWRLVGLGLGLWAAGLTAVAATFDGGVPQITPNVADGPQLAGLLLVGAGLVIMALDRAMRDDWIARIDAVIVGVGSGVVLVAFLWPELRAAGLNADGLAVGIAAGVLAAFLVGAAVRLAITGASGLPSGRFAIEAVLGLAVGSILVRTSQLELTPADPGRLGAGLCVAAALVLAAAAVHPSATRITEREHRPAHELSHTRLTLLTLAAAAAPLCAAVQHLRGEQVDGLMLGGLTTALLVLVAVRLELVVRSSQAQARREVTVRDAAGALGASQDAPAIRQVALLAARDLLGVQLRYVAWIAVNDRGAIYPTDLLGPHGEMDRVDAGIDDAIQQVDEIGDRPMRLIDSRGDDVVIVPIPCRISARAALAVASSHQVPEEVDESLAILGNQIALALDALVQSEELHEKRSEARFQQLVRHSSDAVMIVGGDGRIRYQTPSVVRVLGYLAVDLDGASFDRVLHPDAVDHVAELPRPARAGHARDGAHRRRAAAPCRRLGHPRRDRRCAPARQPGRQRHRAHDPGRDRSTHARGPAAPPGVPRRARRACRTGPSSSIASSTPWPASAAPTRRSRPSRSSTSTTSSSSTTAWATVPATSCSVPSPTACAGAFARVTRRPGSAATSSPSSSRTPPTPARWWRSPSASWRRSTRRSWWMAARSTPGPASGSRPVAGPPRRRRSCSATPTSPCTRRRPTARAASRCSSRPCTTGPSIDSPSGASSSARSSGPRSRSPTSPSSAWTPASSWPSRRWPAGRTPSGAPSHPASSFPSPRTRASSSRSASSILERACTQLGVWLAANPTARWQMSVNLSARQLLAPDLVSTVRSALDAANLEPSCLILELTESVLLADSERVLRRLHRLKDLGVQIAIDDFGTGYSSLSYLQRVPFDILKIDRAFVAALRHEDPQTTLVRTIMDLGRTLGRTAIAEGIEEQVELDGLLALGCELGQGMHFGSAVDAATLERDLHLVPASA